MVRCFEHLLRARSDGNVISEVHPSDDAIRIEEEFGGPRNIRSFRSRPGMQHIIATNNLRIGIRKQRKRVTQLLRLPLIYFRRIDANGDNTNTARVKFRKPLLETPQLGVAERSPESAVENQRDRLRSGRSAEQIAEPDWTSILIQ